VTAPTISGTHATSAVANQQVTPFQGVTIGDLNIGATDTLTITLSNGGTTGLLSPRLVPGLSGGTNGVYTLTGTAAAITAELDDLGFTPTTGALGGSVTTTTFALSDKSSGFGTPTTDNATTVIDTGLPPPTISGTHVTSTTADGSVFPFLGVLINDPFVNALDALTIILSAGGNVGTLTGPGLNAAGIGGLYSLIGTVAAITDDLNDLSFAPAAGAPGSVTIANFALSITSGGSGLVTTNNATTVIDIDATVAPTIIGAVAGQTTAGLAPVNPFTGVIVGDTNVGATDVLTITLSNGGGGGSRRRLAPPAASRPPALG
jgi:hypothetical protein